MWKIKNMLIARGYWDEAGGTIPDLADTGGGASGGGEWTPPADFTQKDTEVVSRGLEEMDNLFGEADPEQKPTETEEKQEQGKTTTEEKPADEKVEEVKDERTEEQRKADEEGIHPPVGDINVMPKSWKAGLAQEYAALPESVKAEIHRREENFFQGIERLKPAVNFAMELDQAIRPFAPALQAAQATPAQAIEYLFSMHHVVTRGTPEQKIQALAHIARDNGIDLNAVAAQLSATEQPYEDPAVVELRNQVNRLQSQLTEREQQELNKLRTEAEREFDAFAKAHPDVNQVLDDMLPLIKSGMKLQDAYDKAIWANPVTRAAKIKAEADAKAAEERKRQEEKAKKAKQASSARVREPSRGGSPTAPLGDIDATLRETYAKLKNQ